MTARSYVVGGQRRGDGRFIKDPISVEDYELLWSMNGLDDYSLNTADAITSSLWVLPAGITKVKDSFTGRSTRVWLSGGTNGESYEVANTVNTSQGRTLKQSIRVRVKTQ